jgi:imidazolonepropionase-like amidohydrolase
VDSGIDFLKVAVSDHAMMLVGADRGYQVFSPRALQAIFDEARSRDLAVLTHTMNVESLQTAVDLDADILIHASITAQVPMPHEIVDEIVRKGLWCEVQAVHDEYQRALETNGTPMMMYAGYNHSANERLLIDASARIIMGTDAGCSSHDVLADLPASERTDRPWTLGVDHFHWMRAIVERGMTPLRAISAATIDVARAYRKDEDLGSVEVGKTADLLLLDADPTAHIDNVRSISAIFQAGKFIDRTSLPVTPRVTA